MDTEFLSKIFVTFFFTLIIVLIPYAIIFLITHKKIKDKTAIILNWVILIISYVICSFMFSGILPIILIILWNSVGYSIIKPKKNKSSEKNNTDTYDSNDTHNADIDIKALIDNQPLKENQIRCNHCGNIQSKNIERCLKCSKIINPEQTNQLLDTDTYNQKKTYQNERIIANLLLNTFSKNQLDILTSNKFTICDCVLFCRYLFMNTLQTNQFDKPVDIDKLDELIVKGIHNVYKVSETECNEYLKKRSAFYNHIFYDEKNDINGVIEELELLIAHDIVANEFVEFNESSPVMLIGFDKTVLIKAEIMQLSNAIIQISKAYIERLKTEDSENKNNTTVIPKNIKSDKKRIDKKDKKKPRFKTATIVLSIMTILFAASTIGISIGLIDISNDNQELSSQITDLENTVSSKDKEIAMYKEQISNLKSRLNNFVMSRNAENNGNRLTSEEIQSHVYYCTNNSSPYYHTSTCPDCDRNGFTIWFDTDAVESAGYLPCPNCIEQ